MAAVQAHDRIRVHTRTCVAETMGRPGRWVTRLTPIADAVEITDAQTLEQESGPSPEDRSGKASVGGSARQSAGVPVRHGVVVLAVGGAEAGPDGPEPDQKSGVYTQQQFQQILDGNDMDADSPLQVALFQCHGSREPGREYCSRVCCPRSLDQALRLKALNPDTRVVIFYRDMMTPGLTEADYTEARKKGVVFVPYEPGNSPNLAADDTGCQVT
jgi:heterodisulfide reductase subunit A